MAQEQPGCNRIPSLEDLEKANQMDSYVVYNITHKEMKRQDPTLYSYCLISVVISFIFGLSTGIILMGSSPSHTPLRNPIKPPKHPDLDARLTAVSFIDNKKVKEYPKEIPKVVRNESVPTSTTVLYDSVYWGPQIEDSMPQGYGENTADLWEQFVNQSEVVKMEVGCGRMQNRLVTFKDGTRACVRYRQNTDQIQGEIFSFYVGRLLNLTNLAPSVVKIVDLKDDLWRGVAHDIAGVQWSSNRAVVLTQYVPSLESATIPDVFKPAGRHLNKFDVYKMAASENSTVEPMKEIFLDKLKSKNTKQINDNIENFDHINMALGGKMKKLFVELAQWSDLIIFDYLTANLDRIVNNLFNYQWNANIMDGPAHNLARKMDSGLLLFLDNESGLLHGYRLLKKYNTYHSLMLDNLCVFRKRTVDSLKSLYTTQSIGSKLSDIFHRKNNAVIRDILPPLPEKNSKVLHERIGKVLGQVEKCESMFR